MRRFYDSNCPQNKMPLTLAVCCCAANSLVVSHIAHRIAPPFSPSFLIIILLSKLWAHKKSTTKWISIINYGNFEKLFTSLLIMIRSNKSFDSVVYCDWKPLDVFLVGSLHCMSFCNGNWNFVGVWQKERNKGQIGAVK